jgi:hypothetical protein
MITREEEGKIKETYEAIKPFLYNELQRRVYAGAEAKTIGHGGISIISKITGMDRETISRGVKEIEDAKNIDMTKVRKSGAGRKKAEVHIPMKMTRHSDSK